MADTHQDQNHPYHMVEPSPWPVLGAGAALVLAVGGILFMHGAGPWVFLAGVAAVGFVLFRWWRDVIREAQDGKSHNPIVRIGIRYGMALFIVTEVMFFFGFFWAFFNAALFPAGEVWPPKGIETFDPWSLPFLNTLILLSSGATLTWAHHGLIENIRRDLVRGLMATILLGLTFTAIQAFEYVHAAFAFKGGIYPTTFYMATGFHGFHVIVGTIFLIVCLMRAIKGHFTPDAHVGFEAAAWYWHFVDVVWLFLFFCIYLWGS
ncbi:MAG: cytochrome c oxidase subunit 3 [Alphaproteobacteria bacterium]|nr:cytochrome c oxidase subunit 3 [Alphaproteobacteria bacterium]